MLSFEAGGSLEPRSDFYSLGCVAFELLCGRPPFVSDNYNDYATMHRRDPVVFPTPEGSGLGPPGDDFLRSLRRLLSVPITVVLPAHKDVFVGAPERVAELIEHHRDRSIV